MLLARKSEIGAKLAPLFERCTRLRTDLVKTEGEIGTFAGQLREIELALKALEDAQAKTGQLTIMQAVMEILRHRPEGMTSQEILAEINTKYFDGTIVRHSLSPQLSRLKNRDGKIDLRGDRWFALPDEPSLFNKSDRRL
jgi:hypothetical protein